MKKDIEYIVMQEDGTISREDCGCGLNGEKSESHKATLIQRVDSGSNPDIRITKKEIKRDRAKKKSSEWIKQYKDYKPKLQNVISDIEINGKLSVETTSESKVKDFMKYFHYLPHHAMVGRRIVHRIYDETGKTIAVLCWSNPLGPSLEERDAWIGCQGARFMEWRKKYMNRITANNVRFCINPFLKNRKNIATQCLKISRKKLISDWREKYGDDLIFYETFVDTDKYKGTCYLADNWEIVGSTKGANFHGTAWMGDKFKIADIGSHENVSKKLILIKTVYDGKRTYKLLARLGLKDNRFYRSPKQEKKKITFKSDKEKERFDSWLDEFKSFKRTWRV